jgi:hypothetical protein
MKVEEVADMQEEMEVKNPLPVTFPVIRTER